MNTDNTRLAAIFDEAIEKHLSDGSDIFAAKCYFSCAAVELACRNALEARDSSSYLSGLGVKRSSCQEFDDIPLGPKGQYARALWLTWAALMAKEDAL
jgi:hypothetical protein